MRIRSYTPSDHAEWRRMRTEFWPDQTEEDMASWLARSEAVVFVAERSGGGLSGFAEAGSRTYAEGCMTSPVAYLEGWYVDPDVRRTGVGRALLQAVEAWARSRGYSELASDAGIGNAASHAAHARGGFREVGRAVLYAKALDGTAGEVGS